MRIKKSKLEPLERLCVKKIIIRPGVFYPEFPSKVIRRAQWLEESKWLEAEWIYD